MKTMHALRTLSILGLALAASAASAGTDGRYAEPTPIDESVYTDVASIDEGVVVDDATRDGEDTEYALSGGDIPLGPDPDFQPVLGPDPDWDLECGGKSPIHLGDLDIIHPFDSALYRCVRWVTGKLTVDPSNQVTALTLPWIERVDGTVKLEGAPLQKARLPRLDSVGGQITVDQRYGSTRFLLPSLTSHAGRLKAYATTATKLTDIALQSLGTLELYWYPSSQSTQQGPFYFSGLSNLTSLGRLEVDLGSRAGYAVSGFLANLSEISGDVEFQADWLFGLEGVELIGGDLLVDMGDPYGGSTWGLASLEEIGGDFDWSGYLSSLSGLANLQTIGGELNLESTQLATLSGLEKLDSVGSLRIYDNQSLSSITSLTGLGFSGYSPTVTIANNHPLKNCQAWTTANTFVGNDPPQIYGNASGTCLVYSEPIYFPRF
jgi:hypothetical protein